MAAINPWAPGPIEGMVPDQSVAQQVGSFMDDPRARAALLSFGLSMMQPPSFGDTFASQVGRSIGHGGEAANRVNQQGMAEEALDIKHSEADSRQDLRAAQADSAISRAQTAETRASAATDRLGYTQQQMELRRAAQKGVDERHALGSRIRLSNMYQKYVEGVAEKNNDPLRRKGDPVEPVLPINKWAEQMKLHGILPPDAAPVGPADDELPPTPKASAVTPTPSNINPPAPRDVTQRKVGQVYAHPDGSGQNIQWTGKGWQVVP